MLRDPHGPAHAVRALLGADPAFDPFPGRKPGRAADLVDVLPSRPERAAQTTGELRTAVRRSPAGRLLEAVADVLAVLFVRRPTSMQHATATGMIPAAM
ncbi:hypothetical protein [Streptomyces griseus]|uniref:hypothetical protein n=1 Tax=Streptomyces griseus TaxID=1911 RepID=UPI0004C57F64|nr:hypothetical protein [Streptomyces griseus]